MPSRVPLRGSWECPASGLGSPPAWTQQGQCPGPVQLLLWVAGARLSRAWEASSRILGLPVPPEAQHKLQALSVLAAVLLAAL